MEWNTIWQAFLAHWISELLILGSTALLAVLKERNSKWAGVFAYGFAGFAFMSIIVFTFTGHAIFSTETPHTTSENVESNVRVWADKFSLGIQKQADDKFSFVYAISLPTGRGVLVGRPKQREGYLQFQGNTALSPEHEAALKKLSPSQLERISDEISLEMARSKVGFAAIGVPFKGLVVSKAVPITSSLTEDSFVATLDEIDSDMLLAREAIRLAFFRNGVPDVMPRLVASQ
jgi:hypothetical protein